MRASSYSRGVVRAVVAVSCALVLGGCGLVLDASPPRGPADAGGIDARRLDAWLDDVSTLPDVRDEELDAYVPHPCEGLADGDECSRGGPSRLICLSGECVPSFCGDGFVDVDAGESCEPSSDPQCGPSCHVECTMDVDCVTGTTCSAGSCDEGVCVFTALTGECVFDGHPGTCRGGGCIPNGCGDGVVDVDLGEECDARTAVPGCIACRFECAGDADCSDGDACNGVELCEDVVSGTGEVAGRTCEPGEVVTCDAAPCFSGVCSTTAEGEAECTEVLEGDADGDGHSVLPGCDGVGDDCDDGDPDVHPGAVEVCNFADDDCDGLDDDETTMVEWCLDGDRDGFGDPLTVVSACAIPGPDFVRDCTDCYDASDPLRRDEAALVNPGQRTFFPVPYCPTSDTCSFDYDCDRFEERAELRISTCTTLRLGFCDRGDGWQGSSPACGEDGTWVDCRGLAAVCGAGRSTRVQTCR